VVDATRPGRVYVLTGIVPGMGSGEGVDGFVPLFNGTDLTGWFATPRSYGTLWPGGPTLQQLRPGMFPEDYNEQAARHPATWTVEDGAIVGRQSTRGWGGYLVSEHTFGDFELVVEANPDWPADTGVMLRKTAGTFHGIQLLVDHRPSGSIAGFFGNGIGLFHAVTCALDACYDEHGNPVGLCVDDPATSVEPFHERKRRLLSYAATAEEFLGAWRWLDWNELRVRVVGAKPTLTSWVNGVQIAELDMATMQAPNYDADAVAAMLGRRGHVTFEVHDNDPMMGDRRWGPGAACRWRNIKIKEL
jgi:hypothetical protein